MKKIIKPLIRITGSSEDIALPIMERWNRMADAPADLKDYRVMRWNAESGMMEEVKPAGEC